MLAEHVSTIFLIANRCQHIYSLILPEQEHGKHQEICCPCKAGVLPQISETNHKWNHLLRIFTLMTISEPSSAEHRYSSVFEIGYAVFLFRMAWNLLSIPISIPSENGNISITATFFIPCSAKILSAWKIARIVREHLIWPGVAYYSGEKYKYLCGTHQYGSATCNCMLRRKIDPWLLITEEFANHSSYYRNLTRTSDENNIIDSLLKYSKFESSYIF